MAILGLDHVNVRSKDPAATAAFFAEVLGMRVGPPMGRTEMTGPGGWVYDTEDRAVVHIGGVDSPYPQDAERPFKPAHGSGAVHHVALSCSDFDGTKARLATKNVSFSENDLSQFALKQLFVIEPNGILLELNFRA